MSLDVLASLCHGIAREKGFWEDDRPLATTLMLIVSELTEILEDDRNGLLKAPSKKLEGYTRFEEELCDVIIRCLDLAGRHRLRLDETLEAKLIYNTERKYKHGKEY